MKLIVGLVLPFHLLRQGLSVSAAHDTAHSRLWPGSYPVHTSCLAVVVLGLQVSTTVPLCGFKELNSRLQVYVTRAFIS